MNDIVFRYVIIVFLLIGHSPVYSLSLHINTGDSIKKMKLMLGVINNDSNYIASLIQDIKKCLEGGWQKKMGFEVDIYSFQAPRSKKDIKQLFENGYATVVFIAYDQEKDAVEWRIYDSKEGEMLKGKRVIGVAEKKYGLAQWLADELWEELTGQEGVFHTKIAYCQNIAQGKKNIYITAPYAYTPELLLKGGKPIAPRWNKKLEKPLLYYSEITASNIRLMSVSLNKKTKKILNNDGITMLPSCSSDGNKVVYCASLGGNSQLYCYEFNHQLKESTITCITDNKGNNVSPYLRDNGDIIFCSDAYSGTHKKNPQICYYYHKTGHIESLTGAGHCTAPVFCEGSNTIAYAALVGNIMQLFTYNLDTKQSCQLTYSEGNKDEPTWSPKGNYIAFSVEYKANSRIAVMNVLTKEWSYITPESMYCSYPAWTPQYTDYIIVT